MKNYFKSYYLLLLLTTVLFACSDSDNPSTPVVEQPILHSELVGVYNVVDATTGAETGDTWVISTNTLVIGELSETYSYAKNQLVTSTATYTVSKKDGEYIFEYQKGGKKHTVTLKKDTSNPIIELSKLLGKYKVMAAQVDGKADESLKGSLWTIGENTISIGCGEPASFTYKLPNTLTASGIEYKVSIADKTLAVKYTQDGKAHLLAMQTTTDVCTVLEQKDIIGTFKVSASTSTTATVGDIFTIATQNIKMGCNASQVAYSYSAPTTTLFIGTTAYKLSKLANTLIFTTIEDGKTVTISLEPTTDTCGSTSLDRAAVMALMAKVADWQISIYNYPAQGNPQGGMLDFTSGTLFIGMHEWANMSTDSKYAAWLKDEIGTKRTKWKISTTLSGGYGVFHADDLCIAQFYLASNIKYNKTIMLTDTKKRLDAIISQGPDETMIAKNKQSWTWCDALFMAPPAYAQAAKITGDVKYLNFMKRQFKLSTDHLYDTTEKLYYRDSNYFNKVEANGKKVFWGRGNGWVVAGIANMLKYLPANYSERAYYETLLVEMIDRLIECQDEQGFWHASLLDMDTYKSPETSASTLITYAIAYGINNGLLDKAKYMPVLTKAWKALETAVHPNGKLGWVQPIGQDPKDVTFDMTAVYGVGGFLLAGSEIAKILE